MLGFDWKKTGFVVFRRILPGLSVVSHPVLMLCVTSICQGSFALMVFAILSVVLVFGFRVLCDAFPPGTTATVLYINGGC